MIEVVNGLIKYSAVTRPTDDSKNYPVNQVKSGGKVSNAYVIYPYGMSAVAPVGALATVLNVQGQEENKACIESHPTKRFKNLKEGEVIFGNFLTGSYVKFLEDGSIEIISSGGGVNLTGNLTVSGDITNTGNLTVDGDIANTGDITSDGAVEGATVTDGIIDLGTHVHVGVTPGGGVSGGPQ